MVNLLAIVADVVVVVGCHLLWRDKFSPTDYCANYSIEIKLRTLVRSVCSVCSAGRSEIYIYAHAFGAVLIGPALYCVASVCVCVCVGV